MEANILINIFVTKQVLTIEKKRKALAAVAQWIECWPAD